MPLRPDDASVERFRRSLAELLDQTDCRFGIAVSGGPDSVALLLLAAAALPNRVEAATVDHRFRVESAGEAAAVAALCSRLQVPHQVLTLEWTPPSASRQARARGARYTALAEWADERGLAAVATAHHRDDQAETLLMRLNRGAGVGGLAGVRPVITLATSGGGSLRLVRPLLTWTRADLAAITHDLGIETLSDPANSDPVHDRSRVRQWLDRSPEWPNRSRVAASAWHLAEAAEALEWAAERLLEERTAAQGEGWQVDVAGVPAELRRRLALLLIHRLHERGPAIRGDRLERALRLLTAGRTATIGGVLMRPRGERWLFAPAPPRRF